MNESYSSPVRAHGLLIADTRLRGCTTDLDTKQQYARIGLVMGFIRGPIFMFSVSVHSPRLTKTLCLGSDD